MPHNGQFLLRFRLMTNRNTRRGKLAFLLIALIVLAGFQPGPAKTQDLEQLRKDAEQGDATAQFNLGVRYRNGQGVPQDYAEAVRWYRLAAEQGYATAQFFLGSCTTTARACPRNAEAVRWYRLAAEQGYEYNNGEGVPHAPPHVRERQGRAPGRSRKP